MALCAAKFWSADLNPTRGHEQAGLRAVLMVSVDQFNEGPADLVVVPPITGTRRGIPLHVEMKSGEAGLKKAGTVLVDAVRSIDRERLTKHLGTASPGTMRAVEDRLRILLDR